MKKFVLAVSALAAMPTSAFAADLPARPLPPALPPAPAYNWNGFYIGVMGGYGWSDRLRFDVVGFGAVGSSNDLKGGFAGGTIGYNFQPGGSPLVLGIEADAAWAHIKISRSAA